MTSLYELLILGAPSDTQLGELERLISQAVQPFDLNLGREIAWSVRPESFDVEQQKITAAVFFGGKKASAPNLKTLLRGAVPVLPVVSDPSKVRGELPAILRPLNCLGYCDGGAQRVATALLECVGLLPRQRRVFLSYRRDETRQTALQLFDALSSRLFDVFLDTHSIAPAENFQEMLWHHLCDSDVLVMLDTPNYFEGRWTSAEFGRALAKGIAILRVGWPDTTPSKRTLTATHEELLPEEIDSESGRLTDEAVARICLRLEAVRSRGYAVRHVNLVDKLRYDVERIGGNVTGLGPGNAMHVRLADNRELVVYPAMGVPASTALHDAATNMPAHSVAIVYDHVGLSRARVAHLDWLNRYIEPPRKVRFIKATEAAWQLADWEH
uniref:TIR domain-containing protein n=1 Tax=Candidatus Kentrum sp. FM TaxID=2126340 RepID=A0A450RVP3_9GAMM|nr:MAG: TIR domain-containing protein [Candidatus Kentron sp. FM]VFJ50100.1 MAG: TIR domain-containing protein [Candidatus Kentron sp. FM]VFK08655.1 MAG: TIR domain-containing protein [Candidatus Kentron sp. FM]